MYLRGRGERRGAHTTHKNQAMGSWKSAARSLDEALLLALAQRRERLGEDEVERRRELGVVHLPWGDWGSGMG